MKSEWKLSKYKSFLSGIIFKKLITRQNVPYANQTARMPLDCFSLIPYAHKNVLFRYVILAINESYIFYIIYI